ncbi:hypothetical protein JZ751_021859 [Albula glossodonta]|uniref:Uncharacterized protein n=1 Tax=Albula glossodonta TaxID=121402 RepID=A0A8T2NLQ1_9TELE|nr:hypothetical protein JZ751_021859 [Albula glossodonta]
MPAHASYVPCVCTTKCLLTAPSLCQARAGRFRACRICQNPSASVENPRAKQHRQRPYTVGGVAMVREAVMTRAMSLEHVSPVVSHTVAVQKECTTDEANAICSLASDQSEESQSCDRKLPADRITSSLGDPIVNNATTPH